MLANVGTMMSRKAAVSTAPVYATWTDLTNAAASGDGIASSGGTNAVWDSAGRSVETASGDGTGVQLDWPLASGEYVAYGLADPAQTTGVDFGNTNQFTLLLYDNGTFPYFFAYYGTTGRIGQTQITGVGRTPKNRVIEASGVVEFQVSSDGESWSTKFQWPDSVHSLYCVRVAFYSKPLTVDPVTVLGTWS